MLSDVEFHGNWSQIEVVGHRVVRVLIGFILAFNNQGYVKVDIFRNGNSIEGVG